MNAQSNTKRLRASRQLPSSSALALALITSVFAGCANVPVNTSHVHLQQPVGRFALVGFHGGAVDANVKEPGNQALQGAAAGALAAPVLVLQTTSLIGSTAALTAAAPVLAPLMVIGALAGAAGGADEPDDLRQARTALAEETSRALAQLSAQSEAERAIAGHLAQRFGDRFTGLAQPSGVPDTADTVFEVQVRAVHASVDKLGNVVLLVDLRIEVFALPGNRELESLTVRYKTSGHEGAHFKTTLNAELGQAWEQFADDVAGLVEGSGKDARDRSTGGRTSRRTGT